MVVAVEASVAPPAAVNTLSTATQEVVTPADRLRLLTRAGRTVLGPLVGPVGAVGVPVAGPEPRHTHGVIALEGAGAAGGNGTRLLVAGVVTVRVLIADERLRHTLAAATAKLLSRAVLQR